MIPPHLTVIFGIAGMLLLLATGLHVAIAILVVSFVGLSILLGVNNSLTFLMTTPFSAATGYGFVVLPLFILMGEFAVQGKIAPLMYEAMSKVLGRIRGGLAIATTGAVAAFGTVTGSSMVSVAVFSKIAVPQMKKYQYDTRLASGVVAASATLAALIPPSGMMIMYTIFTDESLGRMLIGGFIPGALSAAIYMIMIYTRVRFNPNLAPLRVEAISWKEKIGALSKLTPVIILIIVMLGGIYFGICSPYEAGGLGALTIFIIGLVLRNFTLSSFIQSLINTARLTSSLFFLLIIAMLFGKFMTVSGMQDIISGFIFGLDVPLFVIVIACLAVYFVLGTFMDAISQMAITLPIFYPLLTGLGVDGIWFGILFIKMCEIAQITPPIGISVYVTQGILSEYISLPGLFKAIFPFFIADIVTVIMLFAFPQIVLWLPSMMFQ
jgi:tripartite ATP-independent transporter DctM subunit